MIIIVGGGLTGLVAGEQLAGRGLRATILEAEDVPGGACRSVVEGGYSFDYTGHLLHVARPETRSYLEEKRFWPLLEAHERRAGIDVGGHVTPYPIQINTHGLAPDVRRDCVLGFVRAWAADAPLSNSDFSEWVMARFGVGFARHFFFPYNSKLYRARPEELSTEWLGRYVPKPDLEEVLDGAFGLHRGGVGYNAQFHYPAKGGIDQLPLTIADHVPDLRCGRRVSVVNLAESWVETADGERFSFETLVFSGSLPALVDMVADELPGEIIDARAALRWVRVLNLAYGVRGPAPRPEHWLYFPDAHIPYYRVGIPSNHGDLAPEGRHTLSVELSLDPEPADLKSQARRAEQTLVDSGMLDPGAVEVRRLIVVDPAYVVFDHERKQAVGSLTRFFSGHGVMLAGRWAQWKYSAMEDAILDGMTVARRLGQEDS